MAKNKLKVEKWKPIKDFPGYEVSDHGRVRSWNKRRGNKTFRDVPLVRRASLNKYGYPRLSLRNEEGNIKTFNIHKLVLDAFVGPCPDGMGCRHLDSDPENNQLTNLEWSPILDNNHDKRTNGTALSKDNIKIIYFSEESARVVAKRFGISHTTVYAIRHRRIGFEVSKNWPTAPRATRQPLTEWAGWKHSGHNTLKPLARNGKEPK